MKTKRPAAKKRTAKSSSKSTRPLHKRILLHPFSIMVLLCAGVIIVGSTIRSVADSYTVTARVDAQPVSSPAVITTPSNQLHSTDSPMDVSGTCPAHSYVVVYRGSQGAGSSLCTGGNFKVRLDLALGANQLQAKVYNITNQEGPASSPITIFRDPIPDVPTVPVNIPITLNIQTVDKSGYTPGNTPHSSSEPTVSGFAPPFSDITVTFHSEVSTCKTKSDTSGWWTCTLGNSLPAGTHHVDVLAVTPEGLHLTYPTFEIVVLPQLPTLIPERQTLPSIQADYRYQTHYPGQSFNWNLSLEGGRAPFKVTVSWGDGSSSTYARPDGGVFTITHAFPQKQTYTVFVHSVDSDGRQSVLQLFAIVKGADGSVAITTKPGPFIGPLATIQRYLWIVWPAYVAVLLMVLSYWLGEKEMYLHVMGRRLAHHGPAKGKGRRL